MNQFLLNLKGSYLIVPLSIIIFIIMIFIDSKITKKEVSKKEYIKYSLIVCLISSFILYVQNMKGKIDEEIISGIAPF